MDSLASSVDTSSVDVDTSSVDVDTSSVDGSSTITNDDTSDTSITETIESNIPSESDVSSAATISEDIDDVDTSVVDENIDTSDVTDNVDTSDVTDNVEPSDVTDNVDTSDVTDNVDTSVVTDNVDTSVVTDNVDTSVVNTDEIPSTDDITSEVDTSVVDDVSIPDVSVADLESVVSTDDNEESDTSTVSIAEEITNVVSDADVEEVMNSDESDISSLLPVGEYDVAYEAYDTVYENIDNMVEEQVETITQNHLLGHLSFDQVLHHSQNEVNVHHQTIEEYQETLQANQETIAEQLPIDDITNMAEENMDEFDTLQNAVIENQDVVAENPQIEEMKDIVETNSVAIDSVLSHTNLDNEVQDLVYDKIGFCMHECCKHSDCAHGTYCYDKGFRRFGEYSREGRCSKFIENCCAMQLGGLGDGFNKNPADCPFESKCLVVEEPKPLSISAYVGIGGGAFVFLSVGVFLVRKYLCKGKKDIWGNDRETGTKNTPASQL